MLGRGAGQDTFFPIKFSVQEDFVLVRPGRLAWKSDVAATRVHYTKQSYCNYLLLAHMQYGW